MRIALHDALVHERAGVALVAVADDILDRRILTAHAVPLFAGGEAAAAAPAQAGGNDLHADLLVRHFKKGFFKGGIAALGDVLPNILAIGETAFPENQPLLLQIKGNIVARLVLFSVLLKEKALDHLAALYGLFDDFLAVLGLDMGIYDVHRGDVHKRANLAEAVAAGFLEMDGVVGVLRKTDGNRQALFLAQPVQRLIYCHGAAGDAAGAGADHDRQALAGKSLFRLPALGVKRKLCASDHFDSSFRMRSTSATAFSGVIFG